MTGNSSGNCKSSKRGEYRFIGSMKVLKEKVSNFTKTNKHLYKNKTIEVEKNGSSVKHKIKVTQKRINISLSQLVKSLFEKDVLKIKENVTKIKIPLQLWIDSSYVHGDSYLKVLVNLLIVNTDNISWNLQNDPEKIALAKKLETFMFLFSSEDKNTFSSLKNVFRKAISQCSKPVKIQIEGNEFEIEFSFSFMVSDLKSVSLCCAKNTSNSLNPCPW